MSIFSAIKNAIFGKPAEAAPVEAASSEALDASVAEVTAAPTPVDVAAVLSGMSGSDNLNWQGSVVDLMKLVGIDASYENRKSLAEELGNSSYSGSAEDNIALHQQVMKALAENGGNVPASLLG